MNPALTICAESTCTIAAVDSSARELDGFLASVERRALRIAQIATRDRDEALDIVQDAMIQLARSYGARPASEWTPLFYRILNNKVLDWQRRGTVRRRVLFWQDDKPDGDDFNPAELVADASQPNAQDLLQQQQAMQKLEKALRELPARQREAFTLRIWEGLSVEDSAKAMGCSDGSVKTHLFRALAGPIQLQAQFHWKRGWAAAASACARALRRRAWVSASSARSDWRSACLAACANLRS